MSGTALAVGDQHCPQGGVSYTALGVTSYVCTGAPGTSVSATALSIGDGNCPAGGTQLVSANGTNYACNGPVGAQGPKGDAGATGATGPQGNPGPAGGFTGTFTGPVTFNGAATFNGDAGVSGALTVGSLNVGGATSGIIPPGSIIAFGGASAPAGWVLCDGSAVSRTTYAALFANIGTAHGGGDGRTTFNVPDYRGRFLRGVDNGTGRDPDRASRTAMAAAGNTGDAVGSVQSDMVGSHTHVVPILGNPGNYPAAARDPQTYTANGVPSFPAGGNETRPLNAGVNWIIKY